MKWIFGFLLGLFSLAIAGQTVESYAHTIGEKHVIYSKILGEEREVYVYQPQGFWGMDNNQMVYPVTYVLDGESQFLSTVSTIDYLSAAALGNDWMPRTIVVGIPNTNRNRDLTPSPGVLGSDSTTVQLTGGGPQFLAFITTELGPFIDSLYATSTHRTLIGHSLGGLLVLQALLEASHYFENYLAIDPFLRYDDESFMYKVMDTLQYGQRPNQQLFVAVARTLPTHISMEAIADDQSDFVKLTKSNLKFLAWASKREAGLAKIMAKYYPEENHFSIPLVATAEAMKHFYRYYPFPEIMNYYHPSYRQRTDLVAQLTQHYQRISDRLGYQLKPMQSYINSWAYGFTQFGREDLSMDLFDLNIQLYPYTPGVYNSKGYYLLNQGKKQAARSVFQQSLALKDQPAIKDLLQSLK